MPSARYRRTQSSVRIAVTGSWSKRKHRSLHEDRTGTAALQGLNLVIRITLFLVDRRNQPALPLACSVGVSSISLGLQWRR